MEYVEEYICCIYPFQRTKLGFKFFRFLPESPVLSELFCLHNSGLQNMRLPLFLSSQHSMEIKR